MFTDVTHTVKGWLFWDLPTDPWTQRVGASFVYQSGEPLERLYWSDAENANSLRIRPRGVYTHYNPWWTVGLQFQQVFDVRKGDLIVILAAENVFNAQSPWGISSTLYTENRLMATSRQDALELQAGLKYEF